MEDLQIASGMLNLLVEAVRVGNYLLDPHEEHLLNPEELLEMDVC
jgi:hypothetical protein